MGPKKDKKKRSSYTIGEKVKWIEEASKPGMSQVQVATRFGITVSTLSTILKHKAEILAVSSTSQRTKNISRGKEHELEEKLYTWFLKMRSKGLNMDRPIIRKQAEKMAEAMGISTNLTFSAGWLMRWKRRHGVVYKAQHGEQQDADFAASEKWLKEVLPTLLSSYSPDDIFNSDETGVFFRGLPNRGHVKVNEKPAGAKVAKDRLTVLVTANMTGSEKPKLLVIGKAARPRKFPRDLSTLPVQYEHSSKAWMNSTIWDKLLRDWDRQLRLKDRRILLIIDNAPAHPKVANLTHINVHYLPKNSTSLVQPCDAGIIKNFKGKCLENFVNIQQITRIFSGFYRSALSLRILAELEAAEETGPKGGGGAINDPTVSNLAKKVTVLDAVHMLAKAWRDVKPSTIANCFNKAFSLPKDSNNIVNDDILADVTVPMSMNRGEFEELVNQDVKDGQIDDEDEIGDEEDEEDEADEADEKVTARECLAAVAKVRSFCQQRKFNPIVHDALSLIQNACFLEARESQVQQKITDFFK